MKMLKKLKLNAQSCLESSATVLAHSWKKDFLALSNNPKHTIYTHQLINVSHLDTQGITSQQHLYTASSLDS